MTFNSYYLVGGDGGGMDLCVCLCVCVCVCVQVCLSILWVLLIWDYVLPVLL